MINKETHVSGSINIEKELYEKLRLSAAKDKRSISATICMIIEQYLAKEVSK